MEKRYKYIKTDIHTLMGIIFMFVALMGLFICYQLFTRFTLSSLMLLIPMAGLLLYLFKIIKNLLLIHQRDYVVLSKDVFQVDKGISLRKITFALDEVERVQEDLYGLRLDLRAQRSITIKHTILSIQDFEEIKQYIHGKMELKK